MKLDGSLVSERHVSRIILIDEVQGIDCAKWRIHGKGHVPTIVTHDHTIRPMYGGSGLALDLQQGVDVSN